jgi:hypothetical protein
MYTWHYILLDFLKPFIDTIVSSIGIGSLIWGIYTYKKSQVAKRADILFPLIKEFDESKMMKYAKAILDNKPVRSKDIDPYSDDPSSFSNNNLEEVLKYHDYDFIQTKDIEKIRESFDWLLDFFCKLDYLREVGIIEEREIIYFQYYIDRMIENDTILKYVAFYDFPFHGHLNELLNIDELKRFRY